MPNQDIMISELPETTTADDSSYIPIDNGSITYKISVANYNSGANATARSYAEAAGVSATAAAESATNSANSATAAAGSATNASGYASSALSHANEAQVYANNASGYATSAASAAASATAQAQNVGEYAREASEKAEDSEAYAVGQRGGIDVDSEDVTYQNNSKYYSNQAATSASTAGTAASSSNANALKSEGFAVGEQSGTPVTSESPYYENNAKYYADEAAADATSASAAADRAETAVVKGPYISNGYWYVYDFARDMYVNTMIKATGPQGKGIRCIYVSDAYKPKTTLEPGQTYSLTEDKNRILVTRNATLDVTDAFGTHMTITVDVFDDPYGVANLISEAQAVKVTSSGFILLLENKSEYENKNWSITILDDEETYSSVELDDGENGSDGVGIVSITKTSTSGLVDTYTILLTDGSTTTFTVTNGQNGTGSGDMLAANYDPTSAVYNAGGIVAYVSAALSGFSTSLSGLDDVALSSLATGQSLFYNAQTNKWQNRAIDYSDIQNTPTIPAAQVNADWNSASGISQILNKPTLGTAAAKDSTNAVTSGSTDLVESGAVYTQLDSLNETLTNEVDAIVNVYGSKNLAPNEATSGSISGGSVTVTVNDDKSITLNGTATANGIVVMYGLDKPFWNEDLKGKKVTLTGFPQGTFPSGTVLRINFQKIVDGSQTIISSLIDSGSGASGVIPNDTTHVSYYISIANTTVLNNVTFKPMLRDARIVDPTYETYAKTNQQLTAENEALTNELSKINIEKIEMVSYAVVADGVKTWKELLGEAAVKAQTLVTQKGFDQYQFANLWLQGIDSFFLCDSIILSKTDATIDVGFYCLANGGTGVTLKRVSFRNIAANCFITIWDGSAYSEISSQVPANATNIVVKFIGYKFVS